MDGGYGGYMNEIHKTNKEGNKIMALIPPIAIISLSLTIGIVLEIMVLWTWLLIYESEKNTPRIQDVPKEKGQ